MNLWTIPRGMKMHIRNRYFLATDIVLLILAAYLSFVFRLETLDLERYWKTFDQFLLLTLLITPLVFYWSGVYRCYWHYASISELLLLGSSVTITTAMISTSMLIIAVFDSTAPSLPYSIPFIFFLVTFAATSSPRLLLRLMLRHRYRLSKGRISSHQHQVNKVSNHPLRVVIMGAGSAGVMIVSELQQNPRADIAIVGFLDDDPGKHHLHIRTVPVLGNRYDIPDIVHRYKIDQVIIAMPSTPGKVIREILDICERVGVRTKVIPGLYELIDDKVHFSQVRDIQIEDLLRREPVRTDTTALAALLCGKCVLVTGGGGSIGSELCRQVLRYRPSALVMVGHGENSIFEIHNELQEHLARMVKSHDGAADEPVCLLHPVIADIRFASRLMGVFEQYRPDIVFHAAAHKHVPLMEHNPEEAISNNLFGTSNLLQASQAVNVERFVMISTDKAVNPTSIMGASKRAAELLVHQAALNTGRPYVAVRFGNVLGSRGSVVLTFKRQIAAGGPVTVTHPEMRRYFMTIPEAVQLVLQAAVLGKGGEVFTLDMGEQIKIVDLARDMIELCGLEVERDIEIVYSGLRPGEKLYEELFTPDETFERTTHEKIFIATNASQFVPPHLQHWIESLAIAVEQSDTEAILLVLQRLIPQHQLKQAFTSDSPQPLARELLLEPSTPAVPGQADQPDQQAEAGRQPADRLLAQALGK